MVDMSKIVKLINGMNIKTYQFDFGYYSAYINKMYDWYKGYDAGFHLFEDYNGIKDIVYDKKRLNMAKHVCEDHTSLAFNENIRIKIGGEKEQKYMLGYDEVAGLLGKKGFWVSGPRIYELTCALGTGALEWVLSDLVSVNGTVKPTYNSDLSIAVHSAFNILPLSWDSDLRIIDVAFVEESVVDGKTIIKIRIHALEDGGYVIYNREISVTNDVYSFINYAGETSDGYITEFHTGSNMPWFSVLKMPIVNNFDIFSPLGASVYGNALDVLKSIDEGFNTLYNELYLANKKVFYSKKLLNRNANGDLVAPEKYNKSMFYYTGDDMGGSGEDKMPIHEFNPDIRADALISAIQSLLNYLSALCGLGANYYKFDGISVTKTATEVISADSSMYRTVRKFDTATEEFIIRFVKVGLYIAKEFLGEDVDYNVTIGVEFDASIIEDKTAKRDRELKEVELGILTKDEYREHWYGSGRRDTTE